MMPADRKPRSWRSCWRPASPICARSRVPAWRWKRRGTWSMRGLAADADQFLTMAKFRALRLLWARVEQACGLDAEAIVHRRRYRMANADPARSLREHAARDHGDVLGGPRRRQQPSRVLPHTLALGIARSVRAARGAQHATGAAGGIQSRQGVRSRGRLRRHRSPDAASSARRHGHCFRKSRKPAARSRPSSKT